MFKLFRKDKRVQASPSSKTPARTLGSDQEFPQVNFTKKPSLKLDLPPSRCHTRVAPPSSSGLDRTPKPLCPKVQRSHSAELEQSIKRIGTLFRKDTTASEVHGRGHLAADLTPGEDSTEDIITRIRHFSGVTSHSPTVVTPDRSSAGSFPPYESGIIPEIEFASHSEDEESVLSEYSNYSRASALSSQHKGLPFTRSSQDYLKVSIPDSTLGPPTDACEMLWTHKP